MVLFGLLVWCSCSLRLLVYLTLMFGLLFELCWFGYFVFAVCLLRVLCGIVGYCCAMSGWLFVIVCFVFPVFDYGV